MAALVIVLFSRFEVERNGLQVVILSYSIAIFLSGIMTWFLLEEQPVDKEFLSRKKSKAPVKEVLGNKNVWLISFIIMAAYCGYWGTFNFSKYAEVPFAQLAPDFFVPDDIPPPQEAIDS